MSFFNREKTSMRDKSSKHAYDYHQQYNSMLKGLEGNLTFGGGSSFSPSPYEIFRWNVAEYCERFMYSSFDQDEFMSAEEKSLRALRQSGNAAFSERLAEGDAPRCQHTDLTVDDLSHGGHQDEELNFEGDNSDCHCSSSVICKHRRVRPSKSDTNIFSVMSLSFEPMEKDTKRKQSLLKKITHLMNTNFNTHKDQVLSQTQPLKQRCEPTQWNACECHVHIGKHSNCCQCHEPYHRTNCECVQHNGSHSYCCRCDLDLLQEYDQHLKKKRYLRLLSDDEELTPVNSIEHQDEARPKFPKRTNRTDLASPEEYCSGRKPRVFPPSTGRPGKVDRPVSQKDEDAAESEGNHHPCEACCKKLDNIYGTALREVHSMLMDVSRTLLPSTHCCSLESRIPNVSRLRPSFEAGTGSQSLETVESCVAEPESKEDVSRTSEVAVQVSPKDLTSGERTRKKLKRMKNTCTVS